MGDFANLQDIILLWRPMTADEEDRAKALLPVVSAILRAEAAKVGKNLDAMIAADHGMEQVVRSVTVDVVSRALMTSTDQEPMTQMTQSAGGYSATGTFLVPGGGLFIKKAELARLGLRRQRMGVIDFYGSTD
ncbi:MAG: phage Gp19/Gp15/Gp42 family protein [Oscillospiraceae bacterium]|nr:phage Gp19/Gp15/Gp42 family protein [Oscillospiraceae bacterium]